MAITPSRVRVLDIAVALRRVRGLFSPVSTNNVITVEPLLYDHPQNHIGVVV